MGIRCGQRCIVRAEERNLALMTIVVSDNGEGSEAPKKMEARSIRRMVRSPRVSDS